VGFIQYLTPTMMFFIGVYIYGEAFTSAHRVSVGLIFAALFIYTVSSIMKGRRIEV
jgi:chloramphenicol-sensitive protein RarD